MTTTRIARPNRLTWLLTGPNLFLASREPLANFLADRGGAVWGETWPIAARWTDGLHGGQFFRSPTPSLQVPR
jgi:hypothetical protein